MRTDSAFIYVRGFIFLLSIFLMESCATSQTNFKREYRKIWKETIKSEAWYKSLEKDEFLTSTDNEEYISNAKDPRISEDADFSESILDASFQEKYSSLISRAYFRIIAEAQKADTRLHEDYVRLNSRKREIGHQNNKEYRNELELARKRYMAHREMLEGLKSWNAFNEYGSDDLEFFKKEYAGSAYRMFQNGESEEKIINFLIYKLADLYHYEE
jgi:hypothetical protein